jgi:hypothetical protein
MAHLKNVLKLTVNKISDAGYFTDESSVDLATMREGIKLSRRLASSESFAKYKGEEVFPGNHIQTDDELDLYIRNVSRDLTCAEVTFLKCSPSAFTRNFLTSIFISLLSVSTH